MSPNGLIPYIRLGNLPAHLAALYGRAFYPARDPLQQFLPKGLVLAARCRFRHSVHRKTRPRIAISSRNRGATEYRLFRAICDALIPGMDGLSARGLQSRQQNKPLATSPCKGR